MRMGITAIKGVLNVVQGLLPFTGKEKELALEIQGLWEAATVEEKQHISYDLPNVFTKDGEGEVRVSTDFIKKTNELAESKVGDNHYESYKSKLKLAYKNIATYRQQRLERYKISFRKGKPGDSIDVTCCFILMQLQRFVYFQADNYREEAAQIRILIEFIVAVSQKGGDRCPKFNAAQEQLGKALPHLKQASENRSAAKRFESIHTASLRVCRNALHLLVILTDPRIELLKKRDHEVQASDVEDGIVYRLAGDELISLNSQNPFFSEIKAVARSIHRYKSPTGHETTFSPSLTESLQLLKEQKGSEESVPRVDVTSIQIEGLRIKYFSGLRGARYFSPILLNSLGKMEQNYKSLDKVSEEVMANRIRCIVCLFFVIRHARFIASAADDAASLARANGDFAIFTEDSGKLYTDVFDESYKKAQFYWKGMYALMNHIIELKNSMAGRPGYGDYLKCYSKRVDSIKDDLSVEGVIAEEIIQFQRLQSREGQKKYATKMKEVDRNLMTTMKTGIRQLRLDPALEERRARLEAQLPKEKKSSAEKESSLPSAESPGTGKPGEQKKHQSSALSTLSNLSPRVPSHLSAVNSTFSESGNSSSTSTDAAPVTSFSTPSKEGSALKNKPQRGSKTDPIKRRRRPSEAGTELAGARGGHLAPRSMSFSSSGLLNSSSAFGDSSRSRKDSNSTTQAPISEMKEGKGSRRSFQVIAPLTKEQEIFLVRKKIKEMKLGGYCLISMSDRSFLDLMNLYVDKLDAADKLDFIVTFFDHALHYAQGQHTHYQGYLFSNFKQRFKRIGGIIKSSLSVVEDSLCASVNQAVDKAFAIFQDVELIFFPKPEVLKKRPVFIGEKYRAMYVSSPKKHSKQGFYFDMVSVDKEDYFVRLTFLYGAYENRDYVSLNLSKILTEQKKKYLLGCIDWKNKKVLNKNEEIYKGLTFLVETECHKQRLKEAFRDVRNTIDRGNLRSHKSSKAVFEFNDKDYKLFKSQARVAACTEEKRLNFLIRMVGNVKRELVCIAEGIKSPTRSSSLSLVQLNELKWGDDYVQSIAEGLKRLPEMVLETQGNLESKEKIEFDSSFESLRSLLEKRKLGFVLHCLRAQGDEKEAGISLLDSVCVLLLRQESESSFKALNAILVPIIQNPQHEGYEQVKASLTKFFEPVYQWLEREAKIGGVEEKARLQAFKGLCDPTCTESDSTKSAPPRKGSTELLSSNVDNDLTQEEKDTHTARQQRLSDAKKKRFYEGVINNLLRNPNLKSRLVAEIKELILTLLNSEQNEQSKEALLNTLTPNVIITLLATRLTSTHLELLDELDFHKKLRQSYPVETNSAEQMIKRHIESGPVEQKSQKPGLFFTLLNKSFEEVKAILHKKLGKTEYVGQLLDWGESGFSYEKHIKTGLLDKKKNQILLNLAKRTTSSAFQSRFPAEEYNFDLMISPRQLGAFSQDERKKALKDARKVVSYLSGDLDGREYAAINAFKNAWSMVKAIANLLTFYHSAIKKNSKPVRFQEVYQKEGEFLLEMAKHNTAVRQHFPSFRWDNLNSEEEEKIVTFCRDKGRDDTLRQSGPLYEFFHVYRLMQNLRQELARAQRMRSDLLLHAEYSKLIRRIINTFVTYNVPNIDKQKREGFKRDLQQNLYWIFFSFLPDSGSEVIRGQIIKGLSKLCVIKFIEDSEGGRSGGEYVYVSHNWRFTRKGDVDLLINLLNQLDKMLNLVEKTVVSNRRETKSSLESIEQQVNAIISEAQPKQLQQSV